MQVTYLTDGGAPTLVLDRFMPAGPAALPGPCGSQAWAAAPRRGRHLAFDGRLLHGAPPELADSPVAGPVRVTLLVNVWVGYVPAGLQPLPAAAAAALGGLDGARVGGARVQLDGADGAGQATRGRVLVDLDGARAERVGHVMVGQGPAEAAGGGPKWMWKGDGCGDGDGGCEAGGGGRGGVGGSCQKIRRWMGAGADKEWWMGAGAGKEWSWWCGGPCCPLEGFRSSGTGLAWSRDGSAGAGSDGGGRWGHATRREGDGAAKGRRLGGRERTRGAQRTRGGGTGWSGRRGERGKELGGRGLGGRMGGGEGGW